MKQVPNAPECVFCGITLDQWKTELFDRFGYGIVSEQREGTNRIYQAHKKVGDKQTLVGYYDLMQSNAIIYDRRSNNRPQKPLFEGIETDAN